ncbi:uncharacterized protein LOC142336116 isoform X2 [Convolutriloba macropyga]
MTVHYKLIIGCSVAFVGLLIFSIVQQIRNFICRTENPVSSINFYSNANGFHDSSVIVFTGFSLHAPPDNSTDRHPMTIELSAFQVSRHCHCLNGSTDTNLNYHSCDTILRANSSQGITDALIFEAPVNWGANQREVLICNHPNEKVVTFTFVILPQPYSHIQKHWMSLDSEEKVRFVNNSLSANIQIWVHCNFYTNFQLRKTEFYNEHKISSTQIEVTSGSTQNVLLGQTRINFAWHGGTVTKVDKFSDYSVWSLAMLFCAVLLAAERGYTISSRARTQHRKYKIKQSTKNKSILRSTTVEKL